MLANYRNPVFSATSNNNRGTAVAAGASDVDPPSRHGSIIVPAMSPSRYGSQPAVVALQPVVPPAPQRSRSKSRVRAANAASSASRADPHPIPAAPESTADAGASVGSAAQPSHGTTSAGGGVSRHRERRNVGRQAARQSRGDSPPPLAPALEKVHDWC